MTAFGDKYRKTTTTVKEPGTSFGLKYRKKEEEEIPKGPIGTWIDSKTYQGYSGPRKSTSDLPADATTGIPLVLTPPKKEVVGPKATGTISTLKPGLLSEKQMEEKEYKEKSLWQKTKGLFNIPEKVGELFKKEPTIQETMMKKEEVYADFQHDQYVRSLGDLPTKNYMTRINELKKNPEQLIGFVAGASESVKLVKLKLAIDRVANNQETEEDLLLLLAYARANEADKTIGYNILDIVFQIPAFAQEFLVTTPIFGIGKKAAEKVAMKTFKNIFKKSGEKLLKNKLIQLGIKSIGAIAGGTLQTVPSSFTRIIAGTIRNTTPQFAITTDDIGRIEAEITAPGDNLGKALLKSAGEQWVEVVSERSGALLTHGGKWIMDTKISNKIIKSGLISSIIKLNPNKTVGRVMTIARNAGWNGVLGEVFEERIADIGHAVLGGTKLVLPTKEQLLTELIAFSIPGAGITALNKATKGVIGMLPQEPQGPSGITLIPVEPTPLTGDPMADKLHAEIAAVAQKAMEPDESIETSIARTRDWISSVLTNDEASTDKELIDYFQKEGDFSKEIAEYIVSRRSVITALPFGVTKEMKEPSLEAKKAPQEAILGEKGIKPLVAKDLGINITPAGQKLLDKPTPITREFIDWFKKEKPQWVDRAKLSTYTDGEPYFFLPGVEGAEISLRDFVKTQEETPEERKARAERQLKEFEAAKKGKAEPAVTKPAVTERIEEKEPEPTEEMKAMESAELRDRIDELNNLLDTTDGDARQKVVDELNMLQPLINKFEEENEIISVDIKKGGSSVEIRTIEYSDGKFSAGVRLNAGTSGSFAGFRETYKSEKGATAAGIIEAVDFFQRSTGNSKKSEAEIVAILKQLKPMMPTDYSLTEKAEEPEKPKRKATRKLKGEVVGDAIDDFVSGRIKIRMPDKYDIKEDWQRTLGIKWYKKIFKWGKDTSINSPDQVASEMGLTENELMDRVAARIRFREERIGKKQTESLKKNHPYVQIAKSYNLEWNQLTEREKGDIKTWVKKAESERGQFPMDEESRLNARQRDIFGNDAKIDTEAEQASLEFVLDKDALNKPFVKPMTSKQMKEAETQRLLAKQKGQRTVEEESLMPSKLDTMVVDFKQKKITSEEVESPTRDFETSLNLTLDSDGALSALIDIAKFIYPGIKIGIAGTGWRKGTLSRGKFSRDKEGKVIRGISLKDLKSPIVLGHEIGHEFDFVVVGNWNMLLNLSDRIDAEAANWPTEEELKDELKKVSDFVAPFDRAEDKDFTAYRNRRREMVAEWVALYINDKDEARVLAPRFTEGMEAAHPEIIQIEKMYQSADIKKEPHDISKEKILGGMKVLVHFIKKTADPDDISGTEQLIRSISKQKRRFFNAWGMPYWLARKIKKFWPIFRAFQDETVYNFSEAWETAKKKLDLPDLKSQTDDEKIHLGNALSSGDDQEVQQYYDHNTLRKGFKMYAQKELDRYDRIVAFVEWATENVIEARKIKTGFYDLSMEERNKIEKLIRDQVARLGGYIPRGRDGKYSLYGAIEKGTVNMLGMKDMEAFFMMDDNITNLIELKKLLARMGYENLRVYETTELPSEFYKHHKEFGLYDLERIIEFAGVDGETKDIKELKKYLLERSWNKALLKRKWVAGYKRDYDNVFSSVIDFGESSLRKLHKLKAYKRAQVALREIDPIRESETHAMASHYIESFLATNREQFTLLRKGIYLWHLMWKMSFLVQNLTQPLLTTMTMIGKMRGGIRFAPRVFLRATLDALKYTNARRAGKDPALDPMMVRLIDRGYNTHLISGQYSEQLFGVNTAQTKKIEKILSWVATFTETTNRLHAFIAGVNLAKAEGITDEVALFEAGKDMTEPTQFPAGNTNLPAMIAGADKLKGIAKVMFVFKSFQLQYLSFLSQEIMHGKRSATGKASIGTKIYAFGIMAALSGAMGLPFMGWINFILKKLFGIDAVAAIRKNIGVEKAWMADLILHGVPTLAGMNFTYLIGLGDAIFSPSFDPAGQIIGAAYGPLEKANKAFELLKQGKIGEALEQLPPAAIRNILIANRWRREGISFANNVWIKPSGWEVFQKALSFTPARISKQYERQEIEKTLDKKYRALKDKYIRTWKNDGDIDKVNSEIDKWNTYVEDLIYVLYNTSDIEIRDKAIRTIEKGFEIDSTNKKSWRDDARDQLKKEEAAKEHSMILGVKTAHASEIEYKPRAKEFDMDLLKKSVAAIESPDWKAHGKNSPYEEIGPLVTYDDGGTDHAYGKYQIMGRNLNGWPKKSGGFWPGWDEVYQGKVMTPEQLLKDPVAQERIFEGVMKKNIEKFGIRDAISMWYSDHSYAEGADLGFTNADGTVTTTRDYYKKFRKSYWGI